MTERVGFFTDTSVCIGCKACEVACKEWNHVPASPQGFSGESYDNTIDLGADTWRHVAFRLCLNKNQTSRTTIVQRGCDRIAARDCLFPCRWASDMAVADNVRRSPDPHREPSTIVQSRS